MGILTLDNFDVKGKTVLLRVDMNCPIHPDTGKILGTKRIEEIVETINALDGAKIVVISHPVSYTHLTLPTKRIV